MAYIVKLKLSGSSYPSHRSCREKIVFMTEISLGAHRYRPVRIPRANGGRTSLIERTQQVNADLGEQEGQQFLEQTGQLPSEYDGAMFVFTGWKNPKAPDDGSVTCVSCKGNRGTWVVQ